MAKKEIKQVKITADFNDITGKIKPMHAVNNGPMKGKKTQKRKPCRYGGRKKYI